MKHNWLDQILAETRNVVLACCVLVTGMIAYVDALLVRDVSLGILYLLPLVVLAVLLPGWQVLLYAVLVSLLREEFGPAAWDQDAVARLSMGLLAFCGTGLLIAEMVRNRHRRAEYLKKFEAESALRKQAEEKTHALLESSPAAMITVGADGRIEMTNQAARRILGLERETGVGEEIGDYFPLLKEYTKFKQSENMPAAMIEGRGVRRDGEMFYAQMWLSLHRSAGGTKLTAIVADASEQLRDREELGLRQLLMNSRIIASAVSHEIRNLAAAAEVLHGNIQKSLKMQDDQDLEALGQLLLALRKLSAAEVPNASQHPVMGVNVNTLLSELKIILASKAREAEIKLGWEIAGNLPRVRADHSGLLQVLLNLTQNSIRTLTGSPQARLIIAAYELDDSVMMRLSDNGPGVAAPETLFYPFQSAAASSGLGLYVSRAIVRTYGGELQYSRRANETSFLIQLPAVGTERSAHA